MEWVDREVDFDVDGKVNLKGMETCIAGWIEKWIVERKGK